MSNNIAEAIASKNEVIAAQGTSLDTVLTALEGKAAGSSLTMHATITPTENAQTIKIPFTETITKFVVVAYCESISGTGDVSRIKQFYCNELPFSTTRSGRIDVVNADGAADYWSQVSVTVNEGTISLSTSRPCYFAAGETYSIQITKVEI